MCVHRKKLSIQQHSSLPHNYWMLLLGSQQSYTSRFTLQGHHFPNYDECHLFEQIIIQRTLDAKKKLKRQQITSLLSIIFSVW